MIGIIGGYGDIGFHAAGILAAHTGRMLRLGGRYPERVPASRRAQLAGAQWQRVDLADESSIGAFLSGCRVVLNCTGGYGADCRRLIEHAAGLGVSYVDLTAHEMVLAAKQPDGKHFIYGAGSVPGLSELLPRYLARRFAAPAVMEFYYASLGRFTHTAARDYLEGLSDTSNQSMVCWRNGGIRAYPMKGYNPVSLPFSERSFRVYPYADSCCVSTAGALGLAEGRWHMAMLDGETTKVLESGRYEYQAEPERTIARLCQASQVDCSNEPPFAGFFITMRAGQQECSLWLKYGDPSALTGLAAAAAVIGILEGLRPGGEYLWGEGGAEEAIAGVLRRLAPDLILEFYDQRADAWEEAEGEL